jgi:hypothetical protein
MYSRKDAPPRRTVRLLVDLEDRFENQLRPPWLLEELQGELDLGEGALGAVDRDRYRLARGRGYIGALVKSYHFPWH